MTAGRYFKHEVALVLGSDRAWMKRVVRALDAHGDEARFVRAATRRCPVVLVDEAETPPDRVTELVLGVLA